MPPKKRSRLQMSSTPTTIREDSAMDVDSPRISATPGFLSSAFKPIIPVTPYDNLWTDDQISSLFKGVIRWKPAGMHKHFRMIAISEHLRNHGIDPDIHRHTRIPHIWEKLRTYYDLDLIDEREYFDDDEAEDKYVEFSLPFHEFGELMLQRAIADPSEAPTSPPQLELSPRPRSVRELAPRRRRGEPLLKAPRAVLLLLQRHRH
ncbi:hypothetical protein TrVGV298_001674 [Trichoderma virens]|nr:hypothetical protein TrVGV298_001674 [Trichoderma virens]